MRADDLTQVQHRLARPNGLIERRRPGRPKNVSPELIPLLRGTPLSATEPPEAAELPGLAQDQLAGLRGLALALLVSALLWAALLHLVL